MLGAIVEDSGSEVEELNPEATAITPLKPSKVGVEFSVEVIAAAAAASEAEDTEATEAEDTEAKEAALAASTLATEADETEATEADETEATEASEASEEAASTLATETEEIEACLASAEASDTEAMDSDCSGVINVLVIVIVDRTVVSGFSALAPKANNKAGITVDFTNIFYFNII